jgi:plasmid stabilization system protein ParE
MKSARIEFLEQAKRDLLEGYWFYESQQTGLGEYFLQHIYADIESLHNFAGIHSKAYSGYHRLLSKRFPYAVYYKLANDTAFIYAVVDGRRNPARIGRKLPG